MMYYLLERNLIDNFNFKRFPQLLQVEETCFFYCFLIAIAQDLRENRREREERESERRHKVFLPLTVRRKLSDRPGGSEGLYV